ncbi:MAG: hypothetical protein PHG23_03700, partial [Candidatus Pacebacteria bacterium]|nr:hypothetical protein [Candidatus Paceibacterota bacterium]
MSLYQLPELNLKQIEAPDQKPPQDRSKNYIWAAIIFVVGIFGGLIFGYYFYQGSISDIVNNNFPIFSSQSANNNVP